jgi:hypothetical protein
LAEGELQDSGEEEDQRGNVGAGDRNVKSGLPSAAQGESAEHEKLKKRGEGQENPTKKPQTVESPTIIAAEMKKKDEQGQASRGFEECDALEALIGNH